MKTKKNLMQEHNNIYRQEVDVLRDRNDIEKQRIVMEQDTKDRADISLKEYTEMKERIEELTKINDFYCENFRKFIRPFLEANVPPEVIEKIKEGKYESQVKIISDGAAYEDHICHIIKVSMLEKL